MALKLEGLARVPRKQKAVLLALLCLLMGAGYYYLYYAKAASQIKTLETQLAGLEAKIKEQGVIARNLPSFRAEVQKLESQLGVLLDQLPNAAEIPSLLKGVSDVGRDAGLEFVKFVPKPEVPKEFYAEIPVSITVNGDFHNFVVFADKVGHLPRIVNLSDIVFTKPKSVGDARVAMDVSCSATTYRFLEQQAPPPSAAAKGKKK